MTKPRHLLVQTYDAARTKSNQQLEDYVRQIAGARGMALTTDSPLFKELSQGKANLETALGGAESVSLFDADSRQQLFSQALNEFQNALQQQALVNRSNVGAALQNAGAQLAQLRAMQTTTTQSSGGFGGLFSGIAQGLGGARRVTKRLRRGKDCRAF